MLQNNTRVRNERIKNNLVLLAVSLKNNAFFFNLTLADFRTINSKRENISIIVYSKLILRVYLLNYLRQIFNFDLELGK